MPKIISPHELNRRCFLAGVGATTVLAACGSSGRGALGLGRVTSPTSQASPFDAPRLGGDPFRLGVASGDPLSDSVVLWTRLAPEPLAPGGTGGMPTQRVPVGWELARDPGMQDIVARGVVEADPAFGHVVHVDLVNLAPNRWYWYRFNTAGFQSQIARTRTSPAPGSAPQALRFALASCQSYTSGYYTPYPHLVGEDIDLVIFVGDYIYDSAIPPDIREHDGPEPSTLAAYRNRYALYKSDESLQRAHAAFPWVVTWDDHEVDNNWAGGRELGDDEADEVLARRSAAYQAFYEHMPIRVAPPVGTDFPIFRSFEWGDLASFFVLDTRQYRSGPACDRSTVAILCGERFDADRSMLGVEQEGWLLDGLGRSRSRWNILAQQVMFGNLDFAGLGFNADQWDGYYPSRQNVLDLVATRNVPNFVVLSGDIHSSWVMDLARVANDARTPVVGTELVGTSISTLAAPVDIVQIAEQVLVDGAPLINYVNLREKGYVRCEVTRDKMRADYRLVDTVFEPTSPIRTAVSWEIESGVPGARLV